MNPASDAVYAAAEALLNAAAAGLAEDSFGGAIDYKAIWIGLPSFDCAPALHVNYGVISIPGTLPGAPVLLPQQRMVTTGEVNMFSFQITTVRCVETIGENITVLPSPAAISLDARTAYSDLWSIWNRLKTMHRAKTLLQTPSGRREMSLGPGIPLRTAGGVGGSVLQVDVQIDGYDSVTP